MTETTRHDRIFLQVCDDDGEYERRGDITWCQDRIHDTDVEYIRKELHDQQLAASQAMQCTSPFDYSPPCRGIQRVKDELANATKQNVLLRGLIDHILNTYHVPRVPRITEALDATQDLSGLVLCDAKPAMKVIRNESGQIVTTDGDGGYFDVSNYVGESFYLRKQP